MHPEIKFEKMLGIKRNYRERKFTHTLNVVKWDDNSKQVTHIKYYAGKKYITAYDVKMNLDANATIVRLINTKTLLQNIIMDNKLDRIVSRRVNNKNDFEHWRKFKHVESQEFKCKGGLL